jgi:N-acyl-phosphatidylethanolamine-hydrolysing phospholipase D
MQRRWIVSWRSGLAAVTLASLVAAPIVLAESPRHPRPAHHLGRGFRNLDPSYDYTLLGRTVGFLRRLGEPEPDRGPVLKLIANDGAALRANGIRPTVTWIGHATLLVQLDGVNILTDPNWNDHAGPFGIGPRRLIPPGLALDDLPPIHVILLSHDHYDHLDLPTLHRLARAHRPRIYAPLGVGGWLREQGFRNVTELDWWQSHAYRGLTVVATPAQHGSGRGVADQNLRLWSSWAVLGQGHRFFFAGDTGYAAEMAEIGRQLGPFDVAAIPIGGYRAFTARHPNHVNPEEAVRLFEDVRGRLLVPMHWGTFALNREPHREPPERLLAEALRRGLQERVALLSPGQSIDW